MLTRSGYAGVQRWSSVYIELRYQLLPYIYTLFWEAATAGAPILRLLLYDFPNDSKTYALYDQVLQGSVADGSAGLSPWGGVPRGVFAGRGLV